MKQFKISDSISSCKFNWDDFFIYYSKEISPQMRRSKVIENRSKSSSDSLNEN